MNENIFAFALHTKTIFNVNDTLFDENGNIVGRILRKYPNFKDDYDEFEYKNLYTYDVTSSKDIFEKLKSDEIKLWNTDDYTVSACNTYYVNGGTNK